MFGVRKDHALGWVVGGWLSEVVPVVRVVL